VPPHEPTSEVYAESAPQSVAAPLSGVTDGGSGGSAPAGSHGIVDFGRTARRLRTGVGVVSLSVLSVWGVLAATSGASPWVLAELAGLGMLVLFVLEVIVVGGAALRGLLAAGDRGDRLAAGDVSLVPPQLTRRMRR
jgi:hypothetical protein